MRRPPGPIHGRSGFDINEVKLLNETAAIQLTSRTSPPMTMQVSATVKVVEVELSDRFEVAQLILQPQSSRFRATLKPDGLGGNGVEFETVRARLDSTAHMAELVFRIVGS